MRTSLLKDTDLTLAVAKHHQGFAQNARPHRSAVRLGHLLNQAHRQPVLAHELTHGGIALDTAQQLIFFTSDHGVSSKKPDPKAKPIGGKFYLGA